MATKEYAFYPGCSSQLKASASNYLVSTNAMCKTLDIRLTEIPDWNCCGASISYTGASELTRHALNARNFALAEKHLPGQDVVATCAACCSWPRRPRPARAAHSLRQSGSFLFHSGGLRPPACPPGRLGALLLAQDHGLRRVGSKQHFQRTLETGA